MGMIPTPGAGPMLPGGGSGGGAGGGPMIMIPTPGAAGPAAGGPPSARGDKPGGLRSTGSAQLVGVAHRVAAFVRHTAFGPSLRPPAPHYRHKFYSCFRLSRPPAPTWPLRRAFLALACAVACA